MSELVRLYTQIALLRRGPQDVPGTTSVLALTVAGYVVVNFAVSLILPPSEGPWFARLAVEVVFMLAWYAVLLPLVGKPERFVQTASAVFGFHAVLAPLIVFTGWLMRRHGQDPAWQFPLAVLALVLVVWLVAANSYVVRAALEWPLLACVGLVLLQIVAAWLLIWIVFPPTA
jgi:hypothetical protein